MLRRDSKSIKCSKNRRHRVKRCNLMLFVPKNLPDEIRLKFTETIGLGAQICDFKFLGDVCNEKRKTLELQKLSEEENS